MLIASSYKCLYLTISGDVTSVKPLRTKADDKYTTITLYRRNFFTKNNYKSSVKRE